MAKDNIYDKIISELILRLENNGGSNSPQLVITSSLNSSEVYAGYSGNVIFTSTVFNIPTGYTITNNSHIITYPSGPPQTIGSTTPLSGSTVPVSLAVVGNTYTVSSTITLEHATDPDIVLNASIVITAVAPSYYGVQAYSATPVVAGLNMMASTSNTFQMTTSGVGRLIVALPVGSPVITNITDQNGLVYPASDFTPVTNLGYVFYQLNYDTQLTGNYIKTFTINYI